MTKGRKWNMAAKTLAIAAGLAVMPAGNAGAAYTLPGVSEEMYQASWWIDRQEAPDEILADGEQINALNAEMYESTETGMTDLSVFEQEGAQYAIAVRETTIKSEPVSASGAEADDPDLDLFVMDGMRVGEPAVVLKKSDDGTFDYVLTEDYSGWVSDGDLAICADRDSWLEAWQIPQDRLLVTLESRMYLEPSPACPELSELTLGMGTMLERVIPQEGDLVQNRMAVCNWEVYIPVRKEDGSYDKEKALIPMRHQVSLGYLPLTQRNLLTQAFAFLGDAYGWGSSFHAQDCSGFVQAVYRCFGLSLPRDTGEQENAPVRKYMTEDMSRQEREDVLSSLEAGALLLMDGHVVLYLGNVDGNEYCINASGRIADTDGNMSRTRVVLVNEFANETYTSSGVSWLDAMRVMETPYLEQ